MEFLLGQIFMVGFNFAPRNSLSCDGQLLPISQNQALFSLLGTIYGGDGRTTFAIPDLRGRVPMHTGTGPGLTPRTQGQRSGTETNILTTAQLPSHNHIVSVPLGGAASATNLSGSRLASTTAVPISNPTASSNTLASFETFNTGANQSVNNMQPFLVIRFCIAIFGIFPSRN